jgi:predicted esterase
MRTILLYLAFSLMALGEETSTVVESVWLDKEPILDSKDPIVSLSAIAEPDAFTTVINLARLSKLAPSEELDRAAELLAPIYARMREDPALRAVPAVWHFAIDQIRGGHAVIPRHYYAFLPDRAHVAEAPVVVFLHGFGPNLSAWLARVAELTRRQAVIIAPTSDSEWWGDAGQALIETAIVDARKRFSLSAKPVQMIGWSNGGRGVVEYALRHQGEVDSAVAIAGWYDGIAPQADSKAPRLTFLHGDVDAIIPLDGALEGHRLLQAAGHRCDLVVLGGQDHFLFLDQVLNDYAFIFRRAAGE